MKPFVSKIRIYPVKSLDCVEMDEVVIGKKVLQHDREFAMFNKEGKFINGKRTARVNLLRSSFDLENYNVTFNEEGKNSYSTFHLLDDRKSIEKYLSEFFGDEVFIIQNKEGKFLDIPDMSGITIASEASIDSLCESFPGITQDQMRLRFRANIELSNAPAFWEDNLFAEPGICVEYNLGNVKLFGVAPRERCIVPTRDSFTGKSYPYFTKKFVEARKNSLPEWSLLTAYNHFYFFTADTFIPESEEGKIISVGDELEIIGTCKLKDLDIKQFQ